MQVNKLLFFWELQFYEVHLKKNIQKQVKRSPWRSKTLKKKTKKFKISSRRAGVRRPHPFFNAKRFSRGPNGVPRRPPNQWKWGIKFIGFFSLSLRRIFLWFLMILGALNTSESCSHAGRTPDFEKSTFSVLGKFFSWFWTIFEGKTGVWNHQKSVLESDEKIDWKKRRLFSTLGRWKVTMSELSGKWRWSFEAGGEGKGERRLSQ